MKPISHPQWSFKCFWLYGAVEPRGGRQFFYEFSHLDKVCFERYLWQFSQAYDQELLVSQLDNAPSHISEEIEIPENVVLLFQPTYCPEVNPVERVWEYLKSSLVGEVFESLDDLRRRVGTILQSLNEDIVGFLAGWSWILHSLSISGL